VRALGLRPVSQTERDGWALEKESPQKRGSIPRLDFGILFAKGSKENWICVNLHKIDPFSIRSSPTLKKYSSSFRTE